MATTITIQYAVGDTIRWEKYDGKHEGKVTDIDLFISTNNDGTPYQHATYRTIESRTGEKWYVNEEDVTEEDTQTSNTKEAPFFIPGKQYRCIRDVIMNDEGQIVTAFVKGSIYSQHATPSPYYGFLTNEQGERHAWSQPSQIEEHCEVWGNKPEDIDPRRFFEMVED